MTRPTFDTIAVGDTAARPSLSRLRRADLVRYAGASGDFNPIHWNERFAVEVGLPDVIAHGMLTMATAARLVTDWCGDPGAVVELRRALHQARRGARRRHRRGGGGRRRGGRQG